jgi:hypothetical protein
MKALGLAPRARYFKKLQKLCMYSIKQHHIV